MSASTALAIAETCLMASSSSSPKPDTKTPEKPPPQEDVKKKKPAAATAAQPIKSWKTGVTIDELLHFCLGIKPKRYRRRYIKAPNSKFAESLSIAAKQLQWPTAVAAATTLGEIQDGVKEDQFSRAHPNANDAVVVVVFVENADNPDNIKTALSLYADATALVMTFRQKTTVLDLEPFKRLRSVVCCLLPDEDDTTAATIELKRKTPLSHGCVFLSPSTTRESFSFAPSTLVTISRSLVVSIREAKVLPSSGTDFDRVWIVDDAKIKPSTTPLQALLLSGRVKSMLKMTRHPFGTDGDNGDDAQETSWDDCDIKKKGDKKQKPVAPHELYLCTKTATQAFMTSKTYLVLDMTPVERLRLDLSRDQTTHAEFPEFVDYMFDAITTPRLKTLQTFVRDSEPCSCKENEPRQHKRPCLALYRLAGMLLRRASYGARLEWSIVTRRQEMTQSVLSALVKLFEGDDDYVKHMMSSRDKVPCAGMSAKDFVEFYGRMVPEAKNEFVVLLPRAVLAVELKESGAKEWILFEQLLNTNVQKVEPRALFAVSSDTTTTTTVFQSKDKKHGGGGSLTLRRTTLHDYDDGN